MAAHRKLDRRRDDLCVAALRKGVESRSSRGSSGSLHRLVRPPRDDLPYAGERICSRDRRAVGGRRLELNEEFIVHHAHVSHIRFAYVVRRN